uniref:Uncharacterized protein n=1 Tax=Ditylenchus dipsaci TaxID=166011 RepID=A0A915E0L0_9BILA
MPVYSQIVPVAHEIFSGDISTPTLLAPTIGSQTNAIAHSPITQAIQRGEMHQITNGLSITTTVPTCASNIETAEVASPLILDLSNVQQIPFKDKDVQESYEEYQKSWRPKDFKQLRKKKLSNNKKIKTS